MPGLIHTGVMGWCAKACAVFVYIVHAVDDLSHRVASEGFTMCFTSCVTKHSTRRQRNGVYCGQCVSDVLYKY